MPLRKHENILIFGKVKYNPQFTIGAPLHGKGTSYINKKPKNQNYGKFESTDDKRKGSTKKYPTSIISIPKSHPAIARHRTEKPLELMEWLVKTYSDKGDLILDPFIGSGSTIVAAKNTKRKYIGIDISDSCCEITRKRLSEKLK